MPIVVDYTPAGTVVQNLAAVGAQRRRVDDAELANRAIYAALAQGRDQREQQRLEMDQREYRDQRGDLAQIQAQAAQARQQTAAALGYPQAPGGAAGLLPGVNANGGNRPPGAGFDMSALDPQTQLRLSDELRARAQDQQDVELSQRMVEDAAREGLIDMDSMDGLVRLKTLADTAKSGPPGARHVMALLDRERANRERMALERMQGEYGLEREQMQQAAAMERERLQQQGQTERTRMAVDQRDRAAQSQSKRLTDDREFRALQVAVDDAKAAFDAVKADLQITAEQTADDPAMLQRFRTAGQAAKRLNQARQKLQDYLKSTAQPATGGPAPQQGGGDALDAAIDLIPPDELAKIIRGQ